MAQVLFLFSHLFNHSFTYQSNKHLLIAFLASRHRPRPPSSEQNTRVLLNFMLFGFACNKLLSCLIFFLFNNGKVWNYEFASDYSFDNMPLKFLLSIFFVIGFPNNWFEPLLRVCKKKKKVCKRLVCINICLISTKSWIYFAFLLLISGLFCIRAKNVPIIFCFLEVFWVFLCTNGFLISCKCFIGGWQKCIFC